MTSWHNTAKSTGPALEVNAAAAPGSNAFLPGETPTEQSGGETAEAVVVCNKPKGKEPRRAKPNRNTPTPWGTSCLIKPDGEGAMNASTVGSMGEFRSRS